LAHTITVIKSAATLFFCVFIAMTSMVAGNFTQTLTAEKRKAAGLDKLTGPELAELETLVQNFKSVTPAVAPRAATAAPHAVNPTPSWVGALLTLERMSQKTDQPEVLVSHLINDFDGWNGRTIFRLENGQVWVQVNNERYEHSAILPQVPVKIYPASVGTFWLEVEGVNPRCRIKPVRLE
jgi:hypothetical protein